MLCVSQRVIEPDLDHVPRRDAKAFAKQISDAIEKDVMPYIRQFLHIKTNENLTAFLHYQGMIDYMRTHVCFDAHHLTNADYNFMDGSNDKRAGIQGLLNLNQLLTICGPLSWATCEMSALGGHSDIFKIEGFVKQAGNAILPETDKDVWHSWNVLRLPDGSVCYADPTVARMSLELARKRKGFIFNPHSLPIADWERGFFIATHWATQGHLIGVVRNQGNSVRPWTAKYYARNASILGGYKISFDEWKRLLVVS